MLRRTLMATMALLSAAASFGSRPPQLPKVGTLRRGQHNPQGIDLTYMGKSFRNASKYQPHSGKRQNERFARNYGSDENGTIFAVGRKHRKEFIAFNNR